MSSPKTLRSRDDSAYALVVPFHNERLRLPAVIESLRKQQPHAAAVVFLDNGSIDGSGAFVRGLDEVQSGEWWYVQEPHLGKFQAMKSATRFCAKQLEAEFVGFLDADSRPAAPGWIHTAAAVLREAADDVGFVFSPYTYRDLHESPRLRDAYLTVDLVSRRLARQLGWFANAGCGFYATDTLRQYFARAEATTELGLRLSLYALARGGRGYMNPIPVWTSARRIVHSQTNLLRWSLYSREYYRRKDINQDEKIDLERPSEARDLPSWVAGRFFHRQSVKIVCRNLIPLALFDQNGWISRDLLDRTCDREPSPNGGNVSRVLASLQGYATESTVLTMKRFEEMLAAIETHPGVTPLVEGVERLCTNGHARTLAGADREAR